MRKLGQAFIDWAQDEDTVRAWQHEHNLAKLLGPRPAGGRKWRNDSAGILVRIRNILPEQVCFPFPLQKMICANPFCILAKI